jgi:bifunctional enzyme CysN/CysC
LSVLEEDLSESPSRSNEKPLLKVSTAGSVDDGKSSLIGRLLYDSKSIFEDQLEAIERASVRRGSQGMELALLTDGLRAEREQNITIDVAYRYFATPHRKFIIADTPGHEQYTRNMVTGTSTSDVSIVLIDARKGVLPQSKRHAAISALLGVKVVVVAINKMDLVDFSEIRFDEIKQDFLDQAAKLALDQVEFFPISALLGDNVVEKGSNLDWFKGPTLLRYLETVDVPPRNRLEALRLPIQYVIRPDQDFRGFSGQVEAGTVSPGDVVQLIPSQRSAQIEAVYVSGVEAPRAGPGSPVVVTLKEHVDLSRGEMIVSPDQLPYSNNIVEATVCWMQAESALPGRRYTILHANRQVSGHLLSITHRISIDALSEEPADKLGLNDIGRVVLETARPLHYDPYSLCNATGAFIFVDPATSVTIGAGMLQAPTGIQKNIDRSIHSQFFKVSGGTATDRTHCSDFIEEILRRRGVVVVKASLEELQRTVLASSTDAIVNLISVLARSNIGLIATDGSAELSAPVTIYRFDQELWIETRVRQDGVSIDAFVSDAIEETWIPEI